MKLKILVLIFIFIAVSCDKSDKNENDDAVNDSDISDVTDESSDEKADEIVDEQADNEEDDSAADETGDVDEEVNDADEMTYFGDLTENPSENVPLTASVELLSIDGITEVEVLVADIDDDKEPFSRVYKVSDLTVPFDIPVMGLFPDHDNTITLKTVGDIEVERVYTVTAEALPDDFPKIDFEGTINSGWTIANWLRYPDGNRSSIGLAYDEYARIRWYTTLPHNECTPIILKDNHFFCSTWAEGIKEYDFMGYEQGSYEIDEAGYNHVHHDIYPKKDGNIIVLPYKKDVNSIADFVLEINPETENVVKVWDLKKFYPDLQDLFADMTITDYSDPNNKADPVHVNAVTYDESDNTIIVSTQVAGVMKISYDDEIIWYIAPHIAAVIDDSDGDEVSDSFLDGYDENVASTRVGDFKTAAYSDVRMSIDTHDHAYDFDFNYLEFLLKPLDSSDTLIADSDVLNGFTASEDFAWPFRSHDPTKLKNGNIMIFDNGYARNFSIPVISADSYNRAVEYEIVEDTDGYGGTIKQVWEYKLDDADPVVNNFSPFVSGASELENGNRLIVSGGIGVPVIGKQVGEYNGPKGALLIEVDPADNSVVNRVFLNRQNDDFPQKSGFSVYRAYRFELKYEVGEE